MKTIIRIAIITLALLGTINLVYVAKKAQNRIDCAELVHLEIVKTEGSLTKETMNKIYGYCMTNYGYKTEAMVK